MPAGTTRAVEGRFWAALGDSVTATEARRQKQQNRRQSRRNSYRLAPRYFAPRRSVLRPRVAGATIAECRIDARPVGCAQFDRQGGDERCHGVDARCWLSRYHHL